MNECKDETLVDRVRSKIERVLVLAVLPLFIAACLGWGTFITEKIFAHDVMMRDLEIRKADYASLPPHDWRERIIAIEARQERMLEHMSRIIATLELMKRDKQCPMDCL